MAPPPELANGGRGIYAAAALWHLLGDPRAHRLGTFIDERLTPAGPHLLERDAMTELAELLEGVGDAVRESVTDDELIVRDDRVEDVLGWSARRVHRTDDDAYSLHEPVAEAADAARFLRRALAAGCSVLVE
jgi:hypothetical protein